MITAETLLRKLAEWRPAGLGRTTLAIDDTSGKWRLELVADRVETLGCLLWELHLGRSDSPTVDVDGAKAHWSQLASRTTGLLEDLRLIEVDPQGPTSMLRSDSPMKRSETVAYYEAIARGIGQVALRRYKTEPKTTNKREQMAFTMTHEAIARLVEEWTKG
jgi:hypothetical protein